jgi:hypothetical protein
MRRVGVLETRVADDPEGQARCALFLQGLLELGWIDGRNVRIDYRCAWSHRAAVAAGTSRSGDRIEMLFAAVHESLPGS